MSRVKLLFAPENIGFAEKIASALAAQGYEAANDDAPASASLVIWSAVAAASPAILSAARSALARRVLVPVALGKAPPPPSFEHLWPMDLSGWTGREDDPRWRFVLDEVELAVRRGVEATPPAELAIPVAPPRSAHPNDRTAAIVPANNGRAEDLFAEQQLYQVSSAPPGPRIPAAVIAGVAVLFATLAAGAFFVGKAQAPAAAEAAPPPVVAFVQPKDQPADEDAMLTDLPPIEIETAADDAPDDFVAEAPVAALRDPAPPAVTEVGASNSAPLTSAGALAPPSVKQETIASLAENALRESDASAENSVGGEPAEAGEGNADPIAELAWTSTADTAEMASFGSYFRDCVDCPDMAEIREDGAGAYALGVREVTNAQWRACVADGGCPPIAGGADASPVTGASYVDARAFVAWLSGRTGVAYRLPSEGEWDAAAEGAPASGAAPNAHGLYNMADARIEWTEECWVPDGIAAAAEGACAARVLKGSDRDAAPAGERRRDAGFRVARDID